MMFSLKLLTPYLMIEKDINAPLNISPIPQTQSWLRKKSEFTAEGIPNKSALEETNNIERLLVNPKSINVPGSKFHKRN